MRLTRKVTHQTHEKKMATMARIWALIDHGSS
jgi:hypothetical protein